MKDIKRSHEQNCHELFMAERRRRYLRTALRAAIASLERGDRDAALAALRRGMERTQREDFVLPEAPG